MLDSRLKQKFQLYKNIVLLGEAGSGKSEIGINLARELSKQFASKEVHLFDMDQTKPLFRIRDIDNLGTAGGIKIHYQKQVMDSPIVIGGVEAAVSDPKKYVIMDIGGGEQGARLIGQFSEFLQGEESIVLYIVNNYRPWSGNRRDLADTMKEVLDGCGLNKMCFVANPNLGPDTSCEDIREGYQAIKEKLGIDPEFICVLSGLADSIKEYIDLPVLPIELALATSRVEQINNI